MLRISWRDTVSNDRVRIYANTDQTILEVVCQQALSYFGHVMRAQGLEKEIMLGKVEGHRRRGRQRMRWLDGVVRATNLTLGELRGMCADRGEWRRFTKQVTRGQTMT